MDKHRIAMIASIAHEANRAYCTALGDSSQPCCVPYSALPEDQRVKDRLFGAIVSVFKDAA